MEEVNNSNDILNNRKYFLLCLSILIPFGVIMVFSASYIYAKEVYGDSTYYLWRQIIYIIFGVSAGFIISKSKITFWIKYAEKIQLLVGFLILLTFIPGLGHKVKGASRWLDLYFITFQPGELLKLSTILVSSKFFLSFDKLNKEKRWFFTIILLVPLFLVLMQPDFGTFTISLLIILVTAFLSDFPRKYFYILMSSGALVTAGLLISQPYRVRRLFAYLDPWKNSQTSGFQLIQSYLAFANGKFWGAGLGNSNEKLFYLPEAHNDFVFSVVGEELGLIGVIGTVVLYAAFLSFGLKLSSCIKRKESAMISSVIVFTIGIQAIFNMCVVLGLLPTKGLNLPFISSGGTSMVINFICVGLILSTAKDYLQTEKDLSLRNSYVY